MDGPGIGKSVTAAKLFVLLKCMNKNVELVTEYAKDLVYENRLDTLSKDQLYVFSKQNNRLQRFENSNIEYVITDSPLLLSIIYANENSYKRNFISFKNLVVDIFNSYDNINCNLKRTVEYSTVGRLQTVEEAKNIDKKVISLLTENNIKFNTFNVDNMLEETLLTYILNTTKGIN